MLSEYDSQWCNKTLADLTRWQLAAPFRVPVDPIRDGAKNYFDIVKNPMDLQTMKKKLTANEYKTIDAFISDIHLICSNARAFNGESSMYGLICTEIEKWIKERLDQKCNSAEEEWHRNLEQSVAKLQEHVKSSPFQ